MSFAIAPDISTGLYQPALNSRTVDNRAKIKLNHRLAEGIYW